jgi:membrane-associated protease RseP (regulator of RpoE activity)
MMKKHIPLMTAMAFLVACAPTTRLPNVNSEMAAAEAEKQRQLVVKQFVADQRQLHQVAYPILRGNVSLCGGDINRRTGLMISNLYQFPESYRDAAYEVTGLGEELMVIAVAKPSPAAKVGFHPGDTLVAVNGEKIDDGEDGLKKFGALYKEALKDNVAIRFDVTRKNLPHSFMVRPEAACNVPYQVTRQNMVNAFADGRNIHIASGMMRFIRSNNELAIVVGHEVAHNLMSHVQKKQGNAAFGLIFDLIAAGFGVSTGGLFNKLAGSAFSKEFEAEADYVGLYLTARGGFPIKNAPNFWRRMGVAHPASIKSSHSSSHPPSAERFVALEITVKEIEAKRRQRLPLEPEKKPDEEPVPDPQE